MKTQPFKAIAEIVMGQSPAGESCNTLSEGIPLLNGPTEFGSYSPVPVQHTTDPKKYANLGDLLFCVRGSTTGRMNWADQQYAIGRGLAAIRHKKDSECNDYIRGLLEVNLESLLISATGSTFPNISRPLLEQLQVPVRTYDDEKRISLFIRTFNDKIELNRKMNETLEEMARAIFKSWFVDFDPVHAKARGEKPAGMPDEIADLFPSEFVHSDQLNKPIPKGWDVKQVSDFSEKISKGTTPKNEYVIGASDVPSIPFIKVKDISDDGQIITNNLEFIPESIHEKHLKRSRLLENDILFSIAGTIGRVSIVTRELTNSNTNQAVAFIRLTNMLHKYYFFLLLKSCEIQNYVTSRVVQGVQANVSLGELGKVPCVVPSHLLFNAFNSLISPILLKVENNCREINSLICIRDNLLPKLISGEIEV